MRLNKLECHSERRRRQCVVIKKRLLARKQRMPVQRGRMTSIPTQRVMKIERPNELVAVANTTDKSGRRQIGGVRQAAESL